MAFFEWNDGYSVGVAEADEQHRRLIGLIDQLHEAMTQGAGRQSVGSAIDELETIASVLDELVERLLAQEPQDT